MSIQPALEQRSEPKPTPVSAWWLLNLAICFEIGDVTGLNFSEGFSLLLPTALALAAFAMALYLVSHVMKWLPVSVAYPIWSCGGTAGVVALGVVALHEKAGVWKSLGVVIVVAGIVLLNVTLVNHGG